jgi:ferredoxin
MPRRVSGGQFSAQWRGFTSDQARATIRALSIASQPMAATLSRDQPQQETRPMATMITEECINCGACEPECPNTAIYEGGVQFEAPDGSMHDAITEDIYYIVPQKCTECVGFFDQEQCAAVCPVDCCVPNPEIVETEDALLARAKVLHPDTQIPEPPPSRFRR